MSQDKYPNTFSDQMEADCVYYTSNNFRNTCGFKTIGNITRVFPCFSCRIFRHVARLEQSRASENIWLSKDGRRMRNSVFS